MGQRNDDAKRMSRKTYERELERLQVELCRLQAWVKREGARAVVVFEGRDAAGKGGVIRRITQRVSPRVFKVVALPAPTEREQSQLYMQRYLRHFPAAGEIVLFDRSWYNRAGVEPVMGFCTPGQTERFLRTIPLFERHMVNEGIVLIKYFFDVSAEVQEERLLARVDDPRKHWKLSPMDVASFHRWWDYTEAYTRMIDATDTEWAPWYRVPADEKRRARLNCIAHLLSCIPYEEIPFEAPIFGARQAMPPEATARLPFEHEVPQVY